MSSRTIPGSSPGSPASLILGQIAQLVERLIEDQVVAGSTPALSTTSRGSSSVGRATERKIGVPQGAQHPAIPLSLQSPERGDQGVAYKQSVSEVRVLPSPPFETATNARETGAGANRQYSFPLPREGRNMIGEHARSARSCCRSLLSSTLSCPGGGMVVTPV